ncbi:MAG: peroxiredoxin [Parvicellaceae bacterium]|jgi:peroxiredoxin
MAAVPSINIPLGYQAPDFLLPNVTTGQENSIAELAGKNATVVMFICNHCPFVVHVIDEIVAIARTYRTQGVSFIAISSNDIENYPDDSPAKMKDLALKLDFPFPYLYDETQEVAKAYTAACTPDFSVFNADLNCVYRGQMDDSRPGNNHEVNGKDLRKVLDCLQDGTDMNFEQRPSIGCNIKWKK